MGIACVQTSPRPQKKNWDFFSEGGGTSVHRLYAKNPYISNVTQQCRCSPMPIFRAWATCGNTNEKQTLQNRNMCFFLMSIYGHTKGYITNRWRMTLKRTVRRSLNLLTQCTLLARSLDK